MIRVLLVEDDVYVAESLEAHFRTHGMETVVCATGEDALAAPPCDVVLADLKLPGMSGVDLLERLKERDRALPVLVLTG
ncbi:MAG: response regulator, partial [Planctomycetota bacterium]